MNPLLRIYRLLLRLYPRAFRNAYAVEMEEVYAEALENASAQGTSSLLGVLLREVYDLPSNLTREHLYAIRMGKTQLKPTLQGAGDGDLPLPSTPPRAWEVFMAALPHLLFALMMGVSPLFGSMAIRTETLNTIIFLMAIVPAAVALPISIWKHRENWTGSWYVLYIIIAVMLLNYLISNKDYIDPQKFPVAMMALGLAFALYYAARANAIRGFLAALPFAMIVWIPFLENTPKTIIDPFLEAVLLLSSWTMFALVAALAAQSQRLGLSLALALCVLALSGFGHSYLGNYQGGMLPFSEPGPSIRVVVLYGIRTLLVSAAMLLGPQLARSLRGIGLRAGRLGGAGYRLALLGIVLLIAAFLLNIVDAMFRANWDFQFMLLPPLDILFFAGIAVYHIGYALLVAGVWRARENRFWMELALLYGLIPAVPAILFLGWPTRINGPSLAVWQIVPPALLWITVSTWLVARFGRRSGIRPA